MSTTIKILAIGLWILTAAKVFILDDNSTNLTIVTLLVILILKSHEE